MMPTKAPMLGPLKIKLFWDKGYDVIISVHNGSKKTLSFESNNIVHVVMWPKFGNSSISMREVIITSILSGLDQKKQVFWGVVLVQVQQFGIGSGYELEILHQCGKRFNIKSQKTLGANSNICRNYRGKTGRKGPFCSSHPE